MNRIGRILLVLFCVLMTVCLFASCGGDKNPSDSDDTEKNSQSDSTTQPPVSDKNQTGLSISEATLTLATGETHQLTVINLSTGNPTANVTWKSDNTSVVTVSAKGEVKGITDGTATVTATSLDEKYHVSCYVTVSSKPTVIELSETEISLSIGQTHQIMAQLVPARTDTSVEFIWESTVPSVATVDDNGVITALRKGTTSITVRCGELYEICTVTVVVPATSLTLDDSEVTLDAGMSRQLTYQIAPADTSDKTITWTTSDETIATVDSFGIVRGISEGEAVIKATTSNGLSATCKIIVTESVQSIFLDASELTLELGGTRQLVATLVPAGSADVIWTSSDASVVSVDPEGNLTAVKVGLAVISAQTTDGKSATCVVSVVNTSVSITFDPAEVTLYKGSSLELKPIITPENYQDTYTWTSSDRLVVQVSNSGVLTAKGIGTATVTVTGATGISASIKVTVEKAAEVVNVTGITIDSTIIEVREGEFADIPVTITPANATDTSVTYQILTSNCTSIKIKDGKIFAVSTGTYAQIVAVSSNGIQSNVAMVRVLPISDTLKNQAINDYTLLLNAENDRHSTNLSAIDQKYAAEIKSYEDLLNDIGLTEESYKQRSAELTDSLAQWQGKYDQAVAEGDQAAATEAGNQIASIRAEQTALDEKWEANRDNIQLIQGWLDEVNGKKNAEVQAENARYQDAVDTLNEEYDYIQKYL
ncbi:MAG: Ig domain-containing protein [Eubacteriales bacterium]